MIKKLKINSGFTLMELLVVISIIGILITMGAVSYTTAQKKSRDARRQGDMKAIQNAFEQYYSVNDSDYPTTCPASGGTLTIMTGQTFTIPTDPKSPTYTYTSSGCSVTGYCYCAQLEGGNGNYGANCGSGSTHFCVTNLQ